MSATREGLAPQTAVRWVLERLSIRLFGEHERTMSSFHFHSDDFSEVQSLYRALAALTTAQAETVQLITSRAPREVALTVVGGLVERLRIAAAEEWQLRRFRAAEALTRAISLLVEAEQDLTLGRFR